MQIAQFIAALTAVFGFTAIVNPVHSQHLNDTILLSRSERSTWDELYYSNEVSIEKAGRYLKPRENQMLLKQETRNRSAVDCCPSVLEMVEPEGGKNQDDQYVELYRDGANRQRFYELSCHKDVVGKPCRFMDKKLHNNSMCVQKYSYSYAIVKDPGKRHPSRPSFPSFPANGQNGDTKWTLDYIKVRSGCSCVVAPSNKNKHPNKNKRHRTRHVGVH